jgi:hypothetical protein
LLYPAGRGVVTAAIAALVFAMAGPPAAAASSMGAVSAGVKSATPSGDAADFSARRSRHYRGATPPGWR